jgi:hypothetical protein
MARFSHRNTRLTRHRESETFRQFVMPISTLIGLIGLLGMVIVALDHHLNQRWEAVGFAASASAAALPFILFLFRWVRGHFNRQLENP